MKNEESYEMQLLREILPFVRVPPDVKGYNLCMDKIQKIRKYLSEYFYNQLVFVHGSNTSSATARAEQMVDECFKSHTEQFKQG